MGEEGDEKKKVRGERVVNPHSLHSLSLLQYFSRKGGGGAKCPLAQGRRKAVEEGGNGKYLISDRERKKRFR